MPEWKDLVPGMIENFGTRVECVEMLLEFLKCLVEEAGNGKIPISVSSLISECHEKDADIVRGKSRERKRVSVQKSF
jgi:hypothetical protein